MFFENHSCIVALDMQKIAWKAPSVVMAVVRKVQETCSTALSRSHVGEGLYSAAKTNIPNFVWSAIMLALLLCFDPQ